MAIEGYGPPYGMGTSSVAPILTGGPLRDPASGQTWGSRRIDPITKDYVIDATGRAEGMSDVQQLVHMAVATDLGSSAVRNLGQQLRQIERVSSNFEALVTNALEGAVQHIVNAGLIEVVGVVVEVVRPGVAHARLLWRDLTLAPDDPNSAQETAI